MIVDELVLERGRNEAWDCLREMIKMPRDKFENIFGENISIANCIDFYSASEVIEKINNYERYNGEGVIKLDDVPGLQIGQEVSVYYKDIMMTNGIFTAKNIVSVGGHNTVSNEYVKMCDGWFTYYVNKETGEKKIVLDPDDVVVNDKLDDFFR